MYKDLIKAAALAVTFCIVTATVLFGFFTFGPKVETTLFPVQSPVYATVTNVDQKFQLMEVFITATKIRHCQWIGASPMVYRDKHWVQGAIYFTDPRTTATPQREIPTGQVQPTAENTSVAKFYILPIGDRIQMYVYHNCHPFWPTTTLMFDVPIEH